MLLLRLSLGAGDGVVLLRLADEIPVALSAESCLFMEYLLIKLEFVLEFLNVETMSFPGLLRGHPVPEPLLDSVLPLGVLPGVFVVFLLILVDEVELAVVVVLPGVALRPLSLLEQSQFAVELLLRQRASAQLTEISHFIIDYKVFSTASPPSLLIILK